MDHIGAAYLGNNKCKFNVWAPEKETMILHLLSPKDRKINMQRHDFGYFKAEVENVSPGDKYYYMPDGDQDFPDPASHHQPEGVHGPSAVVDHLSYNWQDTTWRGLPFKDLVLYELHVGTFSEEGTFEAIIPRLESLYETGINAIELMPVAQCPGSRNWGYDGVYPFAVQQSYGGPDGLKKLVDACHARGIAVFLDVVYNHLGPEGNYFGKFAPYFTDKYSTPWGEAINFDDAWSDGVRDYFSNNPLHWFEHYHIDGLRLDAIHTVFDKKAINFWELTYYKVKQLEQKLGRTLYMTAESDYNSPKVMKSPEVGGFGFQAQWLDDFHHSLYVLLNEEAKKYYEDFGQMEQLAKAYSDGFVHSGEFVKFRKQRHGASSAGMSGDKFIAFIQNHDQVGNHVGSLRLSALVDFERLKLAAAAVLLAPYVPMLFMGEEYAEDTPFNYFVHHSDEELIKAVQKGREEEFADFHWDAAPPDPQAEQTFLDSKLRWEKRDSGKNKTMLQWHQELIKLRRTEPALQCFDKNRIRVYTINQKGFVLLRQCENDQEKMLCLFNLSEEALPYTFPANEETGWKKLLDSKQSKWQNGGDKKGTATLPAQADSGSNQELPPLSLTVYRAIK
ncbi:malto-oligosyltrehalose trehalohydrolase [Pontibacter sp. 13R65]|uniref:malto-oligosyltrehalose trehalohydrolase n=1 Tax=Pontibacter sp. 13R65 TaxID=3127458 RepID=UPI00301DFA54